jgi:hypothetical protein
MYKKGQIAQIPYAAGLLVLASSPQAGYYAMPVVTYRKSPAANHTVHNHIMPIFCLLLKQISLLFLPLPLAPQYSLSPTGWKQQKKKKKKKTGWL